MPQLHSFHIIHKGNWQKSPPHSPTPLIYSASGIGNLGSISTFAFLSTFHISLYRIWCSFFFFRLLSFLTIPEKWKSFPTEELFFSLWLFNEECVCASFIPWSINTNLQWFYCPALFNTNLYFPCVEWIIQRLRCTQCFTNVGPLV